jgi:hypothetical protein
VTQEHPPAHARSSVQPHPRQTGPKATPFAWQIEQLQPFGWPDPVQVAKRLCEQGQPGVRQL